MWLLCTAPSVTRVVTFPGAVGPPAALVKGMLLLLLLLVVVVAVGLRISGDDIFEFAVLIPCTGKRGGVVFAFGVEGDVWSW